MTVTGRLTDSLVLVTDTLHYTSESTHVDLDHYT